MLAEYGWTIKRKTEIGKGKRVMRVPRNIKEKKKRFYRLKE
jgi:hypothetical protein